MLFYRKISPCLKPKEIIHSNTKDQFHKMPKSKHKGIVPMIHMVKTLIKTTVKVMEKYTETRLNFYFFKKSYDLLLLMPVKYYIAVFCQEGCHLEILYL